MKLKQITAGLVAVAMLGSNPIFAQSSPKVSNDVVKIGVLTDLSGTYSDLAGPGSVIAAKMAIADFSKDGTVLGKKIELVSADHQNKADIAANKAREWYDKDNVDVIVDLVSTNTALAVMEVAEQKNKITLISGAGSTAITNEKCTPVNVHWAYDTYGLANGTAKAVVKQGKKNWYFITADYAFGASLESAATNVVTAGGGKVLGVSKAPFPNNDFSSYLLKAQASGADVVALANAGQDTINSVKQASEFGINKKQTVVPLLMFISDVHSLGLPTAQGMLMTEGFYWDRDEKTRAWSRRFFEQHKRMPTMVHAAVYSSVMNYLKTVQATGTDDTTVVMQKLKATPIDDGLFKGKIRADGKFSHEMFLLEVKKPSDAKSPWDYYYIRDVIPAADSSIPLAMSKCKLVKN